MHDISLTVLESFDRDVFFLEKMNRYTSPKSAHFQDVRFSAIEEHLYSDLSGEAVILSLQNGKYYGLNPVGVTIWKLLQTPSTIADIQRTVLSEYDVEPEIAAKEIATFLDMMVEEKLIKVLNE